MEVKVKVPFRDINHFFKVYNPGDVVDFPPERANSIVERGLAEPLKKPAAPKPRKPKGGR